MKTLLATIAATALLPLTALPLRAQGYQDNVRIEVKVQTDTDREKAGGSTAKKSAATTVTQGKTLEINLSGKPKSPETRTGTWTIWGRPAGKGNDLEKIESGDFTLELPTSGTQKVETRKVTNNYTPTHVEGGGKSGKGGKKVEATGTKFAGYSVVVKEGDRVVGEAYDPMGLKTELSKK